MKRNLISALTVLAVLATGSSVLGQAEEGRLRPRAVENPGAGRPRPEFRLQVQRLQQQIDKLQAERDAMVKELKAIHAAATEEKATKTAAKIKELIGKQQKVYQVRLEELKVRQQRMQQAARMQADRQERPRRGGRRAPTPLLTGFDGKIVKLADHQDQIVVLEWFNFECPFSKYHHGTKRTMADLAEKYKDKGVVWLAVNSTHHTTPEANVAFAKKHKLPYPIIDDRSGRVGRAFGAKTTPHMIVIDKGTIVYDGAIDNAPLGKVQGRGDPVNYVDNVLANLTSGQKAPLSSTKPYGCSVKYKK